MLRILEYVRSGGDLTDDELGSLIHERMLKIPVRTQRNWLRQLILALDGYGGAQHIAPSEKVRVVVARLEAGLMASGSTPAVPAPPPKE